MRFNLRLGWSNVASSWLLGFAGGCKLQSNNVYNNVYNNLHSNQLATNLQIAVDTVWQFVAR